METESDTQMLKESIPSKLALPEKGKEVFQAEETGRQLELEICTKAWKVLDVWLHGHRYKMGDVPGGPVVKNLPSTAGDAGLIPGQGTRIPDAAGQLSPCTTTTEPEL